jgi:hypothetical protein
MKGLRLWRWVLFVDFQFGCFECKERGEETDTAEAPCIWWSSCPKMWWLATPCGQDGGGQPPFFFLDLIFIFYYFVFYLFLKVK